MSELAIRVEGLGKRFRIGAKQERYSTLRDTLVDSLTAPVRQLGRLVTGRRASGSNREIWALQDVNFSVNQGDVLGIIGRNGAGKSTLLKILAQITEPTRGRVEVHGRVGALLEVGTGFHPELTGRENVFLNGAILGMKRTEIDRKFNEIVAFAEVEKFLDTPVKHYSSGMYTRLAFAVAAHLEPEILIVDEVLAVGDAAFQQKCMGKMGDVAKSGRTVLFVSHNMTAISTLTQHCAVLSQGNCIYFGPTQDGIDIYLSDHKQQDLIYVDEPSPLQPKVTRVEITTSDASNVQRNGAPMQLSFEISTPMAIGGAALSFQVINSFGQPVVYLSVFDSKQPMCRQPGKHRLVCSIPKLHLYMGRYSLRVHFAGRTNKFQTIEGICPFEVIMAHLQDYEWVPGVCAYIEDAQWQTKQIGQVESQGS